MGPECSSVPPPSRASTGDGRIFCHIPLADLARVQASPYHDVIEALRGDPGEAAAPGAAAAEASTGGAAAQETSTGGAAPETSTGGAAQRTSTEGAPC
jgi:hypothetical protein